MAHVLGAHGLAILARLAHFSLALGSHWLVLGPCGVWPRKWSDIQGLDDAPGVKGRDLAVTPANCGEDLGVTPANCGALAAELLPARGANIC